MGNILVIDDEASVRFAFRDMLTARGHKVMLACRADEGLVEIARIMPDVVIMDICMPGINGLIALERIKAINGRLPVIMMTGKGTMDTAIESMKLGAFDYQLKPFEPQLMLNTVDHAIENARLMKIPVEMGHENASSAHEVIVGQSALMQDVFKKIGRVAETDATVLLRGESGTGKELLARAIYQHSRRRDQKLVVVNCAALAPNLVESELFGHERGAFTGATSKRVGKFEQASGGTIFLDEIGELPMDVQIKFLRVLQERTIERVGGTAPLAIDVRILAATNRNLEEAINQGNFREDLYHRLNVLEITLPPLRKRVGDVPKLIHFFAQRFATELEMPIPVFSAEVVEQFAAHHWPGNVREMGHMLQRLLIMTRGRAISRADVEQTLMGGVVPEKPEPPEIQLEWEQLVAKYLESYHGEQAFDNLFERIERLLLHNAMRLAGSNQSAAARLLGLNRTTLQAKLKRIGLLIILPLSLVSML